MKCNADSKSSTVELGLSCKGGMAYAALWKCSGALRLRDSHWKSRKRYGVCPLRAWTNLLAKNSGLALRSISHKHVVQISKQKFIWMELSVGVIWHTGNKFNIHFVTYCDFSQFRYSSFMTSRIMWEFRSWELNHFLFKMLCSVNSLFPVSRTIHPRDARTQSFSARVCVAVRCAQ